VSNLILTVNGKEIECNVNTVEELVAHFELKPEHVVVEVDGEIVDRPQWQDYALKTGSVVELVHFVGGG
jgi:sulfur carrier protein